MRRIRRKPKWWHTDWVELGCRGWNIDVTGAGLGEDGELDWQYAHLDRDTLDLIFSGKPAFVARVISDMVAATVLRVSESDGIYHMTLDCSGAGRYWPATLTGNITTAGSGHNLRLVS